MDYTAIRQSIMGLVASRGRGGARERGYNMDGEDDVDDVDVTDDGPKDVDGSDNAEEDDEDALLAKPKRFGRTGRGRGRRPPGAPRPKGKGSARPSGGSGGSRKFDKSKVKCFGCGKTGHFKAESEPPRPHQQQRPRGFGAYKPESAGKESAHVIVNYDEWCFAARHAHDLEHNILYLTADSGCTRNLMSRFDLPTNAKMTKLEKPVTFKTPSGELVVDTEAKFTGQAKDIHGHWRDVFHRACIAYERCPALLSVSDLDEFTIKADKAEIRTGKLRLPLCHKGVSTLWHLPISLSPPVAPSA